MNNLVLKMTGFMSLLLLMFSIDAQQKPEIKWVKIPAGNFLMGSPINEADRCDNEIQHRVNIDAFKMSAYEVTFDQYDLFCEATGRGKPGDNGWGRGNRPVINVSWNDAKAFADWMGCRLPTEAEWEYACRAGKTTPFNTGRQLEISQANFYCSYNDRNLTNNSRKSTQPVGGFTPNSYGLYDMHGNVWECCSDLYGDYSSGDQTNPKGCETGLIHVFRGGSWNNHPGDCRSAKRDYSHPGFHDYTLGFRLVTSN